MSPQLLRQVHERLGEIAEEYTETLRSALTDPGESDDRDEERERRTFQAAKRRQEH